MSGKRALIGLVVLAALALGAALLAPALAAKRARSALEARGVDATVAVRGTTLTLTEIVVNRGGVDVRCDEAALTFSLRGALARPPVAGSTQVGACRVTRAQASAEPTSDQAPSAPDGESPDPWGALSALGRVDVGRVDVSTGGRFTGLTATLTDLRGDAARGFEGTWLQRRPFHWETAVTIAPVDGGTRLSAAAPIAKGPATLALGPVTWRDGQLELGETRTTFSSERGSAVLVIDGASLERGVGGTPRVEVVGGTLTFSDAPPEGSAQPAPTPAAPAPAWQRLAERAAEAATRAVGLGGDPAPWFEPLARYGIGGAASAMAARIGAATALNALPFEFTLSDVELVGAPSCAPARLDQLVADAEGLSIGLTCSDATITIAVPVDPRLPVRVAGAGTLPSLGPYVSDVHIDAALEVETGPTVLTVRGEGESGRARVTHDGVAPAPVDVVVDAWTLEAQLGETLGLTFAPTVGGVPYTLALRARNDGATQLDAELGTAEAVACADVWASVPAALRPRLGDAHAHFTGEAQPRASASYTMGDPGSFELDVSGLPGTCSVRTSGPYDPAILLADDFIHRVPRTSGPDIETGPGTDSFVPIDTLPAFVPALMYLSEEVAFFDNAGFSVPLIERAVRMNIEGQRYVYGGSTVSQQLVKNLFFSRDKTLARKLEEAVVVWSMESVLDKYRILELYLNCIEFGPEVYGIGAAAAYYYGRPAVTLDPLEAAFLAALKPAPLEGGTYRRRGHAPERGWWPERMEQLLNRLVEYGPFIDAARVPEFAPFVARFPAADAEATAPAPWPPIESLRSTRTRLGLDD